MRDHLGLGHDVPDLVPPSDQRIRQEIAVAPPPQCLGSHDGGRLSGGEGNEILHRRVEGRLEHVVRIPAKARALPRGIRRIRSGTSPAPEGREMAVVDARRAQRCREGLAVELSVTSGARHPAHVGQLANAVRVQPLDEDPRREGGVTDGVKAHQA